MASHLTGYRFFLMTHLARCPADSDGPAARVSAQPPELVMLAGSLPSSACVRIGRSAGCFTMLHACHTDARHSARAPLRIQAAGGRPIGPAALPSRYRFIDFDFDVLYISRNVWHVYTIKFDTNLRNQSRLWQSHSRHEKNPWFNLMNEK